MLHELLDAETITAGVKKVAERGQEYYKHPLKVEVQGYAERSECPVLIISEMVPTTFWLIFTRIDKRSILAVDTQVKRGREVQCGLYDSAILDIFRQEAAALASEIDVSVTMLDYTETENPVLRKKIA